ncbi:MAG: RyR domain-containing protein [Thermodesulfovibrio sp.]|nr:RyR domain-containing protein [Thermodesulfovibrio sp.]MDW7972785.1 RyR domain-containing protein [Thermodesulfovibrio sp.]
MKNKLREYEFIDKIAKKLHEAWVKEKLEQGWKYGEVTDKNSKIHSSLIPYEELTEEEKEIDRMYVREISKILENKGLRLIKGKAKKTFNNIERIASFLHELWREKRIKDGWTYASTYSHENKTDPQLIEYEKLPEESKALNRKTASLILKILEEEGYQIKMS